MSLQFIKAGTSDALTLTGISKRAFESDVLIGGPSSGEPPGYLGYKEIKRDEEFVFYSKQVC
ncbi:hypothetical protein SAMN02745111_01548 [Eubacterium uniforme]|uniref:Uncharacterized protein n=1 Tax=Eubacterium uniforme TaxID=39495 RepID=A0A1T4VT78_9FIRM|nr:hypothetical protein [Eubacterium uniforme]SKA68200.1 hypothetical protein SAMN02745111_01548 [Eubacterium uniforme]